MTPLLQTTAQACAHGGQVYRGAVGEWRCCQCSAEIPVQVYEPPRQTAAGPRPASAPPACGHVGPGGRVCRTRYGHMGLHVYGPTQADKLAAITEELHLR